jgi:hypothetical protein
MPSASTAQQLEELGERDAADLPRELGTHQCDVRAEPEERPKPDSWPIASA